MLRLLLILLVLINLGLFAFFNPHTLGKKTAPRAAAPAEIAPEKLVILSQSALAALPKRSLEPLPRVALDSLDPPCFEWGILNTTNVVRAKTALNKLQLNFIEKLQAPTQTQRFWVYLPPLNSVTDAERKTIELKKLGIKDVLVMQDPEWKNAISFGVFLDEQRAITLLKDLKAKGVSNAVQTVQNATENTVSLRLEPLTDAELIAVKKLQAGLAQSTLTEVSCYN
jgi:hypothetical protein